MSNLNVTFLGKAYSLPEDILVYIDLLDFANSVQAQLMAAFSRKLGQSDSGFVTNQEFAEDINQQVKRFIGKLCDYGIFNRTVNDYLKDNNGYQLISNVNKDAFSKSIDLMTQKIESWKTGYEDAMNKAESSITGMGFSIWSGSLINHALYAAMQASTIDKQEKAASKQYQKDMEALDAKLDSQFGKETSRYINNMYIPHMESSTMAFAYELLDRYLSDLIANHKFDAEALKYVDIERSNDLLDNLSLSSNKKAVLESAFVACPFNYAVYHNALKYDLLDYRSFQTAKHFKHSDKILSELQQNWGKADYPATFNINYQCVRQWAICIDKAPIELLRSLTETYATGVIKAYERIADMMLYPILYKSILQEYAESVILDSNEICGIKAHECVDHIVPFDVWNQLTCQCGHTDLQEKIKAFIPNNVIIGNKTDIDIYFTEQLTTALERARLSIISQIEEKKRKKHQQIEEQRQESLRMQKEAAEASKKTVKIVILSTILVLVAVVCSILWDSKVTPVKRYKMAGEYHLSGQYEDAIRMYKLLDDYKDSQERIKESQYCFATELMESGQYRESLVLFDSLDDYKDSQHLGTLVRPHVVKRNTIAVDSDHAVGIQSDGTMLVAGNNESPKCRVNDWENIIDVAMGKWHTVGLRSDGTVVAVGSDCDDACNVSGWKNVIAVTAGYNYTIGLRADGTVLVAGDIDAVSEWDDLIAVEGYDSHIIGLKSDGTVVTTADGDISVVSDWTDIISITGDSHIVGLRADGTVVSTYVSGSHNVSTWKDVVSIAAGSGCTYGIQSDGNVLHTGANLYDQANASRWGNILDIVADGDFVIGRRPSGAIATAGRNSAVQSDLSRQKDIWKNVKLPE